ncbi:DUF4097 family beta strand repeat-containing protein [Algoriphagus formosus]|uniref:DUF4097 domain-containing protein n=1 Tax=Algoriphagus formosus TaxID=2007308 RepID=A0A4R5V003_9BACT|nr:DUF4097 family beta strand repeat-containing protein [Algoriphagus aquimaris]TDK44851.1 hypothetical protein E1898_09775 [Algoriphagus aquimaris]
MNNILKTFNLCFALLLIGSSAFAQNVLVDVNKSYSNIEKLEIEGGWLEVTYEGGFGDEVQVEAYLESNDEDQDIVFVTLGNVLKIKYERGSRNVSWGNSKNNGYIRIKGPESIQLDVQNSSGSAKISRVNSETTRLKVTSGRIIAEDIQGDLIIGGTSGNLIASIIGGDVTASLTSGRGEISQVDGDVSYKSTSGSLNASEIRGEINVQFTSGRAELENIGALGALKFTSGSMRAENAGLGPNTSFSGSSGNFRIQTNSNLENFNFDLSASSGNLRVGNSRGNKSLELDNGAASWVKGKITSGSISIEN